MTTHPEVRNKSAPATLIDLFQSRATLDARQPAFTFRGEDGIETSLSFGELDRRARAVAAELGRIAEAGHRALLVYPAGLDFIPAFCGCIYAGLLAVPATYPKPRRPMPRLSAVAQDSGATIALTTSQTLATLELARTAPELEALRWIATDELPAAEPGWEPARLAGDDLAYLQYTSGSTSEPKGVMVTHQNLLANLEMIRFGFGLQRRCDGGEPGTGAFWLPAYHDMGLIGGILMALYTGGHSVLMPPASFLQRPLRWLQAISDHQASVSGGPNFGYELCLRKTTAAERARLDLRHWKVAFCGAEPIRAQTLKSFAEAMKPCGFRDDAFYPCYGLAESTLLASGGRGAGPLVVKSVLKSGLARHRVVCANGEKENVQQLVGCGHALLDGEVAIVDPLSGTRSNPRDVGEIWIKGAHVTRGYWNRSEESGRTFCAQMANGDDGPYLRTGDLGFLSNDNLFVTGRLKEVIIIRGRNLYPQDIELTVRESDPVLGEGAGAAFSVELDGEEALVVMHELQRKHREIDPGPVLRRVRRAVVEQHDVDLAGVVLIRQASLPRTTSGKPQRNLCRERYLAGQLKIIAQWSRNGLIAPAELGRDGVAGALPPALRRDSSRPRRRRTLKSDPVLARIKGMKKPFDDREIQWVGREIQTWLAEWLVQCAGVPHDQIDGEKPYAEYGLDSLTAVELSQEIEDALDVRLAPTVAWDYPTLSATASYLGRVVGGVVTEETPDAADHGETGDFESLLAEIEHLSDEEAEAALERHRNNS
jgi:acyl-CoA synthetase (AMP-forming)/AMP-acid ligase II/acyl carrier protein